MVPMIIRVWCEGDTGIYVPVTPSTTCRDVIECCRDPGEEKCHLLKIDQANIVQILHEDERPLDFLLSQESGVHFVLRYAKTGGRSTKTSDGMKEPGTLDEVLPEGVELTLGELRAMALRQQQQIDCQHQLLAAREQRLRFLKQQEARHHQVAAENERLRRLRERVEAQELKLRRLRALRGQLDQTNLNNVALSNDLESIRALFNEKEKELSVAVAKVEELTRQLEEVRRGRAPPRGQPPAALELDKLRRELMYRNKLNEQQNARLSQQREALTARQAEMASIDQRISELQGRLQRKRVANRQLATQISGKHHAPRSNCVAPVQLSNYPNAGGIPNGPTKNQQTRGNIAAIEPYNHIPHAPSVNHAHNFQALKHNALQNNLQMKLLNQTENIGNHLSQQEVHYLQQKQFVNQGYNGVYPQRNMAPNDAQFSQYPNKQNDIGTYQPQMQQTNDQKIILEHINKYNIDLQKSVNHNHNQNVLPSNQNQQKQRSNNNNNNTNNANEQEFLPEFAASKSDPKYQTLPYNTKFTVNGTSKPKGQFYEDSGNKPSNEPPSGIVKVPSSSNVNNMMTTVSGSNLNHMTAHSTPLTINKGLATPLTQCEVGNSAYQNNENNTYHLQKSDSSTKCDSQEEKENIGHLNVNGANNLRSNSEQNKVNSNGQYKMQGSGSGGRADLVRAFTQQNTVNSTGQMKPVSSVAPTSVQVASGKPSPIYQTSSTKIQPVQPQTVSHSVLNNNNNSHYPKSIIQNVASNGYQVPTQNSSSQSLLLSPPQSSSTPMSTPDVSGDKLVPKPALPPKPASKNAPNEVTAQHLDSNKSADLTVSPSSDSQQDTDNVNQNTQQSNSTSSTDSQMIIKARPLTIRKQPLSEQPKLRNQTNIANKNGVNIATTRRIEMPPAYLFPEMDQNTNENNQLDSKNNEKFNNANKFNLAANNSSPSSSDTTDRGTFSTESSETSSEDQSDKIAVTNITDQINCVDLNNPGDNGGVTRRIKKGNLKQSGKVNLSRRVSFDPLALLLDASLEGELELVQKTATQVANASAANDEGITALHNAICAGHFEIVKFLVEFGCDVNAQDSDGWTPLHCAASCNNVAMVRFLVENGACIFATTLSDHETAAQKCEEDEEGFDGCSEYLYSVQEKLGIMNGGTVFAVFPYKAHENDELTFIAGTRLSVVRKGDDAEREWWWARAPTGQEGYVPRNLLGLYPRVTPKSEQ
ncbi:ankyrin-repeat, SH3-domain, and Proline-rich-region containing Protein isoform X3 [Arctopsyche grandis]|uniref:ankyrin-repeat, SH3-domain, and Proline-rich-region containing Protein isoform X3 n=1 Tax=Arctopsyche grandis TaxID=121162 RepID=UPI00406D7093